MHRQFWFVTHFRSKNLIDIKMYPNEESLALFKHLNLVLVLEKQEDSNYVVVLTFADLNMQM
jgi:hypothetical protein